MQTDPRMKSALIAVVGMILAASPAFALQPPTTTKCFGNCSGTQTVPLNGVTALTFQITNGDLVDPLSGIAFTDMLPSGLEVASPNGLTGTCGAGTITANPGATTISLTGGTLGVNSFCTFTVNVKGTTAGQKNNTTGNVQSSAGIGSPALATVHVVAPPTITKIFVPDVTKEGSTVQLNFTLSSPAANSVNTTGVTLADSIPPGLQAIPPANPGSCNGTPIIVTSSSILLAGATLAPGDVCAFSVTIQADTPARYVNDVVVTTNNAGPSVPGSAPLLVIGKPLLSKKFAPNPIALNAQTTLTLTLTSNNHVAGSTLIGIDFNDPLPAGLIVVTPGTVSSASPGCSQAVLQTTTSSISMTSIPNVNGILPPNATCVYQVIVQATTRGLKVNTTSIVDSDNGGDGPPATDSLLVLSLPVTQKEFIPSEIKPGDPSALTFTITNPNTHPTLGTLTNVSFTDGLPGGVEVVTPGVSAVCGGTLTTTVNSITLSGATIIPSGNCTFSVPVKGTTFGAKLNTTGPVSSNAGPDGPPGQATLHVLQPPIVDKTFQPNPVLVGSITTLSIKITNSNQVALTGVTFNDILPASLTFVNQAPTNTCGGTVTVTPAPPAPFPTISLSGGTVAASSSCTVTIGVQTSIVGSFTNVVTVGSSNGGPGTPDTEILVVNILPPNLSKAFVPDTIAVGASTILTFSLSNPNAAALTGVKVSDNLPPGVIVFSPVATTNNCGGTLTTTLTTIELNSALTLPPNSSCSFSVKVTANTPGDKLNTATVTSTNGGNGTPANAILHVSDGGRPTILKEFSTDAALNNTVVMVTFTIGNPTSVQLTNVSFTDTLPTGLQIATVPPAAAPASTTCTPGPGFVFSAPPLGTFISLTGATLPAGTSCTVTVPLLVTYVGPPPLYVCNTTSLITSDQGTGFASTDCITLDSAIPVIPTDAFQVKYVSNLDRGDSVVNVTNPGTQGAPLNGPNFGPPTGNICVNAYVFSPDEQLVSCCSCLVTPNGLNSFSVLNDLISNTLTGVRPNSAVIKLVTSFPITGQCNPATVTQTNLAPGGARAWGTTLHQTPASTFAVTETRFSQATLSFGELNSIVNRCTAIVGNGSSFGICRTCRAGGLGAGRL